ncbi:MAG: asparagine synthase (glutamine-hydrolyzing) [Nitrospira sp.]|nr:asparagine synthase (glutamine-hydrolyzing) [Nitrospira sp.]
MCGFVAFFQDNPRIDLEIARLATAQLTHRGPDGSGEWVEGPAMLFHRRLSIIDLATGQQPMVSGDGRYVVVFNGEIYNFESLRSTLQAEGIRFRTHSDTEVLLEGFAHWGESVAERLNGIFAFVVWDRRKREVFGARDRLGIKPLCWAQVGGALVVSSTLEPLDRLHDWGAVDPVAVRDLLAFDYIPSPRSIRKGVQKLEPGCRFRWHPGDQEPKIERYWMPPRPDPQAEPPDEHTLERLLQDVVRRQMISDVPIGVFLSGGIDSSLLVALMARQSEKPVRSFSIAFKDSASDESSIAGLVARQFGTDHTVLPAEDCGPDLLLNLLGSLDEPFADPAVVPTYLLAKMTAGYVKVALSGDGGDEVFGGYPKYLLGNDHSAPLPGYAALDRSLRAVNWRPRGMSHLYWRTLSPEARIQWSWVRYGDFPVFRKDLRQVLGDEYHGTAGVSEYFEPWERRARRYGESISVDLLMRADLETYLSENCLVKTDRASMLASLEVRVPFLDEWILDRILPLHADHKIINGTLKALLMPLAKRLLPRQVWDRPKHGFHVPLDRFLAGSWKPAVDAALDWGETHARVFDYGYLRGLHARNVAHGGIGRELWNPFVFLSWAMARSYSI